MNTLNPKHIFSFRVLFVLVIGLSLSVLFYNVTNNNVKDANHLKFENEFIRKSAAIQREIDLNLQVMQSLRSFELASELITREEFREFVNSALQNYKSIQALSWVPRISNTNRDVYESKNQKRLNGDFMIKQRSKEGKMIRAKSKEYYFSVAFIEPLVGNKKALGYDISSNPIRMASINRAIQSNQAVTTGRITLVQEKGTQFGVLVLIPVWDKVNNNNVLGLFSGVYRIGDMINAALNYNKTNNNLLDLWLVDVQKDKEELLFTNKKNKTVVVTEDFFNIKVAGRNWRLYAQPSQTFIDKSRSPLPFGVIAICLFITLLIAYIILLQQIKENDLKILVDQQTLDLLKSKNKVDHLNEVLLEKIEIARTDNQKKDKTLIEQSKMVFMGEMVGSIAHQWRQPLSAIALQLQFIEDDFEDGLVNKEYLATFSEDNMKIVSFMSKTIDDFRNFFRAEKLESEFYLQETIDSVISLMDSQLKSHEILVEILVDTDCKITNLESEFKQVLLNIINNAKDIFLEKKIKNPKINIEAICNADSVTVSIQDNAGGIPEEILGKIFESYFTTKDKGKGTGLGLYMSKLIVVDNMKGELLVSNVNGGARFEIKLARQR